MNPNALNTEVARTIRQLRTELGFSQEYLADLCDLDRTYISSVERGKRNLTLATLEKIIPHLSISTSAFLDRISASLNGGHDSHD